MTWAPSAATTAPSGRFLIARIPFAVLNLNSPPAHKRTAPNSNAPIAKAAGSQGGRFPTARLVAGRRWTD